MLTVPVIEKPRYFSVQLIDLYTFNFGYLASRTTGNAPAIDFVKPLSPAEEETSPAVFGIANFLLQFCPTDPSETALMARFARIGVGAGKTFDASKLSPEMQKAIADGIADAWG